MKKGLRVASRPGLDLFSKKNIPSIGGLIWPVEYAVNLHACEEAWWIERIVKNNYGTTWSTCTLVSTSTIIIGNNWTQFDHGKCDIETSVDQVVIIFDHNLLSWLS